MLSQSISSKSTSERVGMVVHNIYITIIVVLTLKTNQSFTLPKIIFLFSFK